MPFNVLISYIGGCGVAVMILGWNFPMLWKVIGEPTKHTSL